MSQWTASALAGAVGGALVSTCAWLFQGFAAPSIEAKGVDLGTRFGLIRDEPSLAFAVIGEREGQDLLDVYVTNEGTKQAIVHRLEICPPGAGGLLQHRSEVERTIDLENPPHAGPEVGTVGDLLHHSSDDWYLRCINGGYGPHVLKMVNGRRAVPAHGASEQQFNVDPELRLWSSEGSGQTVGGWRCGASLSTNEGPVVKTILCNWRNHSDE